MDKKIKINLGFDIGTTSVGWSIIDENYNIIDMWFRLFEDPANAKDGTLKNAKRRESRSLRRMINRTRNRKQDLLNFFVKQGLAKSIDEAELIIDSDIHEVSDCKNPVEIKVKGLSKKLSDVELMLALFHYIHQRGFFYETIESKKEHKKDVYNADVLPSIQIMKFFDDNGWFKNSEITKNIPHKAYVKEIGVLLNQQGKNEKFIEKYLDIFNRMRRYDIGPGSEKSPTPYGMYYLDENNKLKCKENNLWYETIGKCTVYNKEFRGAKNAPISELFNLINDLNNLYFGDRDKKITQTQKLEWFKNVTSAIINNKAKNVTINELAKLTGENKELIKGYRIDSADKEIFTKLENYTTILKFFIKNHVFDKDLDLLNQDTLVLANEIFEIVRKNQNLEKARNLINEKLIKFKINFELIDELIESLKGISASHSLSYKAMLEYIYKCGLKTSYNQMYYFN